MADISSLNKVYHYHHRHVSMLRLFDPFLFGKSSVWRYFLIRIFYLLVVTVPKGLPYFSSLTIAIGWFVTGDLLDTLLGQNLTM